MNFKFLTGNKNSFQLEPMQVLSLRPYPTFNAQNVEFCYQFDDEEPVRFATGPEDLQLRISPSPNGNISFNDNGRTFKLFAREIE